MAAGPDDTIFVGEGGHSGGVLQLVCSTDKFKKKRSLELAFYGSPGAMVFGKGHNLLIASKFSAHRENVYVEAVEIDTGEILWQITPDMVGDEFYIVGLCVDDEGNVLKPEFDGNCVKIVDTKTGKNLGRELVDLKHLRLPCTICCFTNQPRLVVGLSNDGLFICDTHYK